MNKISKEFEEELKGVEAALRRAALKAKQEAERLGVPYVVQSASAEKQKTTKKNKVADRKDSIAGAPVFNRTVTLRDAWQK